MRPDIQPLAGEPVQVELSFQLNPPLGPGENIEPYVARVTLHFPYPRCPDRVETVAEVSVGPRDYLLPGWNLPARPHGAAGVCQFQPKSVTLPALWPGAYPMHYTLAPARAPAAPRGQPEQVALVAAQPNPSLLSVWVSPASPSEPCGLPLYLSNLAYTIYRPGIDFVEAPGQGKIYFTLRRTGYPVIDTVRSTGATQPEAAPDKVTALVRLLRNYAAVELYANQQTYTTQIFGPALRKDADIGLARRSGEIGAGIAAPPEPRAASSRLSDFGEGVLRAATENGGPGVGVDYQAVVNCSLKALVRDPNNVLAYVCASLGEHALKNWAPAYDFFLTGLVHLLVAERMHRAGRTGPSPFPARMVESLTRAYLGAGFWDLLGRAAGALRIQCGPEEFPSLRSLAG